MKISTRLALVLCLAIGVFAADRAVVTNEQRLYRDARAGSKTVGHVSIGEEVSVTGREGSLLQVSVSDRLGWTLANGLVVLDSNPRAAALLFDAADTVAKGDMPEAWLAAARLFRKAAAVAPQGPYASEALWRAADLTWRAEERAAGPLSHTASLADLRALVRQFPKTSVAARADYLLLRSSLCDFWEGTPGCPEAEINSIARYLEQYAHSEHAAELRYALAYRHAALVEIYLKQDAAHFSAERAVEHKAKARSAIETLLRSESGTPWAARGERLLHALDSNEGVFSGIELALQK